jgi:phosphoadenosine phosphosulfate reductase
MTLEKTAIKTIISLYDPRKENIGAFSGGKDSVVLLHLLKLSGLEFSLKYNNTTIDPPGHINFIRSNFPDVEIIQPRYSFWELIERYGLPTRQHRFCCQHLKEFTGKGAKVFEGLRIDESKEEEIRYSRRGKTNRVSARGRRLLALKEPEACDTRVKGKIHAYPIMNWTTTDIWKYIHDNKLPYSDFYDKGFHRLGCIGCPLGRQEQRIKEYKMYPRFVYTTIKAIEKNIIAGKNGGTGSIGKHFSDPYEAFYWWISEVSIQSHKKLSLFPLNYKEVIEKMFPLTLFKSK